MKAFSLRLALCLACLSPGVRAFAAEDDNATSARMKEVLKAKLADDAKNKNAKPTLPPLVAKPESATEPAAPVTPPAASSATAAPVPPKPEPTTVLPKVEVRKNRITELDRQIYEQEKDIAREKKNTKSTEVDNALNDSKVAQKLSIFGGESSSYRKNIAKERMSLMETERDILEAIAHAKTKEEKAALQKELTEIKALRRDLEKSYKQ
jgi:hypothetical protein